MIAKPSQLTVAKLLDGYQRGMFTIHETGMQILMLVDPEQPDIVMGSLPKHVIAEIRGYPDDYDPSKLKSFCIQMCTGPITESPSPTIEQVAAARNWIALHGQR